jgi:hypothetical protein
MTCGRWFASWPGRWTDPEPVFGKGDRVMPAHDLIVRRGKAAAVMVGLDPSICRGTGDRLEFVAYVAVEILGSSPRMTIRGARG